MRNDNSWEEHFSSLPPTTTMVMDTTYPPSSLLLQPLVSTLVTLYLLLLLYLPNPFFSVLLFPLLISTSILLFLLRLGTSQQLKHHDLVTQPEPITLHHGTNLLQEAKAEGHCDRAQTQIGLGPESESSFQSISGDVVLTQLKEGPDPHCYGPELAPEERIPGRVGSDFPNEVSWPEPGPVMGPTFVGWEMGGPLEVIYEAYEGEEEGYEDERDAFQNNCDGKFWRYPSLSRCYPESDSGSELDSESSSSSSREGEFPGMELWDREVERDELIEIAVDYYGDKTGTNKKMVLKELQIIDDEEEDNLIEIDISPPELILDFVGQINSFAHQYDHISARRNGAAKRLGKRILARSGLCHQAQPCQAGFQT